MPKQLIPDGYSRVLADLKTQVRAAQGQAQRQVNTRLVEPYWSIGDLLSQWQASSE